MTEPTPTRRDPTLPDCVLETLAEDGHFVLSRAAAAVNTSFLVLAPAEAEA